MKSPHSLLFVNKEFCDLLGYGESEICVRGLKDLVGPRTDVAALVSGMQTAARIETVQHHIFIYNRHGQAICMAATFSPFLSDRETLAGCLLELLPTRTSGLTMATVTFAGVALAGMAIVAFKSRS